MKVLVFVKATPNSEKGLPPAEDMQQLFAEMGRFNEELVKAGIMKDGDGLKPSRAGKRIKFSEGKVSVVDGPFAETKELVAGYWIWEVKSVEEAVEWARRCPNPMPGEEGVLEIRPTYTAEDFGALMTDEDRAREERLRARVAETEPGPQRQPARRTASRNPKQKQRNAGASSRKKAPRKASARKAGANSAKTSRRPARRARARK